MRLTPQRRERLAELLADGLSVTEIAAHPDIDVHVVTVRKAVHQAGLPLPGHRRNATAEVMELLDAGWSRRDIARRRGVGIDAVHRVIRAHRNATAAEGGES